MRNWMLSGCAVLLASVLTACPPTATKPVITAFTASPTTITSSGTDVVTLAWTVTGATDVAISSDNADAVITLGAGSPPITATAKGMKKDTTFTVTAKNATGNSTQDAKVTLGTGATIVSSVPADAATGVAINSTIAVTFSAAMDKALTQAAFTSSSVTSPTFAWTNGDKTLTVTSSAPLNTPVAAPGVNKTVSYSFAATAKDATGAALASTAARTFVTQKAILISLVADSTLTGNVIYTTGLDATANPSCGTGTAPTTLPCEQNNYDGAIQAGDNGGTAGGTKVANPNFSYKGFVGFDITSIPAAVTASTLVSAQVSLTQAAPVGTPYVLGSLKLQAISGVALATKVTDGDKFFYYEAESTATFDLSADATVGVKNVTVNSTLLLDLTNRSTYGNRSLYRLIFPKTPPIVGKPAEGANDGDGSEDLAQFNTGKLNVVYSQP
jgi:Bacterial Ig-like domain